MNQEKIHNRSHKQIYSEYDMKQCKKWVATVYAFINKKLKWIQSW